MKYKNAIYNKDANTEMEYKEFPFELKAFSEDEQFFYFEGYLSTFGNKDRGNDVVMEGAFDEFLKENKTLKLLWSHKSTDPPLGIFADLIADAKGLFVKARMPKNDSFVTGRIIPQLQVGSIDSMSMGFSIIGKDGAQFIDGKRFLKNIFLWEGSLVNIPMNAEATITKDFVPFQEDIAIADRDTIWMPTAALGRVMEWAGVENGGIEDPDVQDKFKKAFLWFDEEDPQMLSSYKLLITDVIDGILTVVPRAVFSAAGAMKGSIEWVWIWRKDEPGVIRTIERYYDKIGLESPFGGTFRVDDLSVLDEKTMESLFRSGFCVSKKLSKTLVSFIKAGIHRDDEDQLAAQRDADASKDWADILESIKSINI